MRALAGFTIMSQNLIRRAQGPQRRRSGPLLPFHCALQRGSGISCLLGYRYCMLYLMLIMRSPSLSFMEFRPNMTGILSLFKVIQSAAQICLSFIDCCGGDAGSQAHSAFALCVGFIIWISVSLGAAILIFKPSRENKCRGTAAI